MTNYISRGRQTVLWLTNKTAGAVAYGDVVILSSATAGAFISTTSAGQSNDWVGVVLDASIAQDAEGRVVMFGYVPQINLSGAASLGDYLETHSVAKQAAPTATRSPGAFGQVLGTGTSPAAAIWGAPDSSYGTSAETFTFGFHIPGALTATAQPVRLLAPYTGTITNVVASVGTAPTGADLIIDIHLGGTTIFTNPANRPTIAAGANDDISSVPDVIAVTQNDVFTLEIDQIGSTVAGSDLNVQIRGTKS